MWTMCSRCCQRARMVSAGLLTCFACSLGCGLWFQDGDQISWRFRERRLQRFGFLGRSCELSFRAGLLRCKKLFVCAGREWAEFCSGMGISPATTAYAAMPLLYVIFAMTKGCCVTFWSAMQTKHVCSVQNRCNFRSV